MVVKYAKKVMRVKSILFLKKSTKHVNPVMNYLEGMIKTTAKSQETGSDFISYSKRPQAQEVTNCAITHGKKTPHNAKTLFLKK